MNKFTAFLLNLLLYVPVALLGALVLSDLWGWFIVPTFAAPTLSVLQAIGVILVVSFFKIGLQGAQVENMDDQPIAKALTIKFAFVVIYLLLWGLGYLWQLFI